MNNRAPIFTLLLLALTGCSPDSEEASSGVTLVMSSDDSENWANIDLGQPEENAGVFLDIAFGLEGASVGGTESLSLDSVALGAGDALVDLEGVTLERETLGSDTVYEVLHINDVVVTNEALSSLCDAADEAFVRVAAHVGDNPPVQQDLPLDLTCLEDARRPELLALVGEANPNDRPCRLQSGDIVREVMYDAAGHVYIVDEIVDGVPIERTIYEYEGDNLIRRQRIAADTSLLISASDFEYSSGVLTRLTRRVPNEEPEIIEFVSDEEELTSDLSTYSVDGNTFHSDIDGTTLAITFAETPVLSQVIAYPRIESAALWSAQSMAIETPGGEVQTTFVYDNGRIAREESDSPGVPPSEWEYDCP